MKYDSENLLVKDDGDGGDTARNEWSLAIANYYNKVIQRLEPYIRLFSKDFSVLVRNPNKTEWWSDPNKTSRDQTLHAFTYFSLMDTPDSLQKFQTAQAKRSYVCPNGDVMWASMNVIWRAKNKWWLYPLVVLWDIFLIFGALERCHYLPRWNQDWPGWWKFVWRNDPDDVGDDLNLQMSLMQPNMPSPTRALARFIYSEWRPINYGNYFWGNLPEHYKEPYFDPEDGHKKKYRYTEEMHYQTLNKALGCWVWYYRKEAKNDLWLPTHWKPICEKYFL